MTDSMEAEDVVDSREPMVAPRAKSILGPRAGERAEGENANVKNQGSELEETKLEDTKGQQDYDEEETYEQVKSWKTLSKRKRPSQREVELHE